MKWILLLACMLVLEVKGQKVSLTIEQKSIRLENDTLKFKIRVHNFDTVAYVFYNLDGTSIEIPGMDTLLNIALPRLLVRIYDRHNRLPDKIRATLKGFRAEVVAEEVEYGDLYKLVRSGKVRVFDVAIGLWPIYPKRGIYKLQVRYFSNDYYDEEYANEKKGKASLRGSKMFKGVLMSNICSFRYVPYKYKEDYL